MRDRQNLQDTSPPATAHSPRFISEDWLESIRDSVRGTIDSEVALVTATFDRWDESARAETLV
jgi:hypothetical protein